MAPFTLAIVAAINALTATSFGAVAARLSRRSTGGGHALAVGALAAWWGCMSTLLGLQALEAALATIGVVSLGFSTGIRMLNGPLLATGSWGLCFHVLYLWTGRERIALYIAPFFALVGFSYIASVVLHPIVDLIPSSYELTAVYDPPLEGALWTFVLAAVGLPLIVATTFYLVLVRKLDQRDQRRRAMLASAGILLWVGSGLVIQLSGEPIADFVTYTAFGMLAAILVFLGYFPPGRLRAKDAPGNYVELRRGVHQHALRKNG
ncbi:MAG TPA: hypothetical protein VGB18_00365 [Candidatus Thermoplasmatota archaeon]